MRRRPIAVYRVIDEEELLGGDSQQNWGGWAVPGGFEHADAAPAPRARRRLFLHGGWASTAAAVAGLSVIVALLLSTSAHAPAASRPLRVTTPSRQRQWIPSRSPTARATVRPRARRGSREAGLPRPHPRLKPRPRRRLALQRKHASGHVSERTTSSHSRAPHAGSVAQARPVETPRSEQMPATAGGVGPSAEFGFER